MIHFILLNLFLKTILINIFKTILKEVLFLLITQLIQNIWKLNRYIRMLFITQLLYFYDKEEYYSDHNYGQTGS